MCTVKSGLGGGSCLNLHGSYFSGFCKGASSCDNLELDLVILLDLALASFEYSKLLFGFSNNRFENLCSTLDGFFSKFDGSFSGDSCFFSCRLNVNSRCL